MDVESADTLEFKIILLTFVKQEFKDLKAHLSSFRFTKLSV